MGWTIRTIRAVVVAAVVAGAGITVAPPASAATQTISGTVVAPIATSGPSGFSTNFQGVMVDGSLGVYQFQLVHFFTCCPRITLTASDGSILDLQTPFESYAEIVPGVLYSVHREVVVTAGTGRFAGASGRGTYDSTSTPGVPLLITPLGAVMVGSLSLELTTP
jgi:hypothetical protein